MSLRNRVDRLLAETAEAGIDLPGITRPKRPPRRWLTFDGWDAFYSFWHERGEAIECWPGGAGFGDALARYKEELVIAKRDHRYNKPPEDFMTWWPPSSRFVAWEMVRFPDLGLALCRLHQLADATEPGWSSFLAWAARHLTETADPPLVVELDGD
jgi:hypothetical protein